MKPIAELHERVDAINSELVAETARRGRPITCQGKGCCACCYEPVYCSSAEVQHMVEGLSDDNKKIVGYITRLNIDKVKSRGLFEKDMPPVMEWRSMGIACPFLMMPAGTCMVYERRPVSCRSHMAVGPAEWCTTNRLEQKYPEAHEVSVASGREIIKAHLKLGNVLHNDNLLALLENELLGEYHPTASEQEIVFEVDKPAKKD